MTERSSEDGLNRLEVLWKIAERSPKQIEISLEDARTSPEDGRKRKSLKSSDVENPS